MKHSPHQPKLDFTRGQMLHLRREISLPPTQKFLLWALDDAIRNGTSWTLSIADLMKVTGFKETATRDGLNSLKDAALIWWKLCPDGRREYFITWQNIEEAVDAQTPAQREEDTAADEVEAEPVAQVLSPASGPAVRQTDHESACRTESPLNGPTVRQTDSSIRKIEHLTEPLIEPSSPSSARQLEAIDETMVVMVGETGIRRPEEAVRKAIANGMARAQLAAVIDHYNAFPGRWLPGVLFDRLTRAGAWRLPAAEGWFGDSPEWTARKPREPNENNRPQSPDERVVASLNLEGIHGAALDELTPEQLLELASTSPRRFSRRDLESMKVVRPNHPDFRAQFLLALDDRLMGKVPPLGTPPPAASSSGPNVEPAAP